MKIKKRPSKRFLETRSKIEDKTYELAEAVALAKATSTVKFDASVEVHVRLGIDPKKGDQQLRATVSLPHGTGKEVRIAAIVPDDMHKDAKAAGATLVGGEELIDEIAKTKKIDADVVVTTPDMMKNMAKIAKILGPKGIMPNPKTDTVTSNPVKQIKELSKGKVSYKNDNTANVHVGVGKISFDDKQLIENINAFLDALKKAKPAGVKGVYIKSLHLSTSMGPSIKLTA
jgi:large subunit ribosomal protein L1